MRKILLMSDTHSHWDDSLKTYCASADEIWHAGDIGSDHWADQLRADQTLRAVYGNIDGTDIRSTYPALLDFEVEGVRVHMRHIGGYPPRYAKGVAAYLKEHPCDLMICGHSHILKVIRDRKRNLLHMNPGAAGLHGFHKKRTMLRFTLDKGGIHDLEVIELIRRP